MSTTEVKKIRPSYERVVERFGDVAEIRSGLVRVLESILYIDPDAFMESVVCELQMMYCMSGDAEILLLLAQVFKSRVSRCFHAKIYDAMEYLEEGDGGELDRE